VSLVEFGPKEMTTTTEIDVVTILGNFHNFTDN